MVLQVPEQPQPLTVAVRRQPGGSLTRSHQGAHGAVTPRKLLLKQAGTWRGSRSSERCVGHSGLGVPAPRDIVHLLTDVCPGQDSRHSSRSLQDGRNSSLCPVSGGFCLLFTQVLGSSLKCFLAAFQPCPRAALHLLPLCEPAGWLWRFIRHRFNSGLIPESRPLLRASYEMFPQLGIVIYVKYTPVVLAVPQSHRTVKGGRDLWSSSGPTRPLKQGRLDAPAPR